MTSEPIDLTDLTDAQRNSMWLAADALEKRAKQVKDQLKPLMNERMEYGQPENAMVGDTVVASISKVKGGSKISYRVSDPIMYAKWLDEVDAQLHGKKATTTVRWPKDECMEQDYLVMIANQCAGYGDPLPRGVKEVTPRADSIRVTYNAGALDDIFSGRLSTQFQTLLLEGALNNDER